MSRAKQLAPTKFFSEVLGSPVKNVRNSWGSYNAARRQVFLRVWEDQLLKRGDKEVVQVLNPARKKNRPGFAERLKHLEFVESGARAYGVLCVAKDPGTSGSRRIKSYDALRLLELIRFEKEGELTYGVIGRRVPISEVLGESERAADLVQDLTDILTSSVGRTAKEALVNARIGQGKFRTDVLAAWENRCAVTGITETAVLRASHIKPWRLSSDAERLDPENGLPLIATLDALFDAGLIGFERSGLLVVSSRLLPLDVTRLGLEGLSLNEPPKGRTAEYLSWHRSSVFIK